MRAISPESILFNFLLAASFPITDVPKFKDGRIRGEKVNGAESLNSVYIYVWKYSDGLLKPWVLRKNVNWSIFLIFFRKQVLTFNANCLQWRQFAFNVKSCFPGKIRKKFNLSSAEFAQSVVKSKEGNERQYECEILQVR